MQCVPTHGGGKRAIQRDTGDKIHGLDEPANTSSTKQLPGIISLSMEKGTVQMSQT
jgi:hypothetical protein